MADLIDRQEAIRLLRGECVAKYPSTFVMGLFAAADEINKLPTIDPADLRSKGRWNFKWDAEKDPKKLFVRIVCSECDLHTGQKSNFCPNCGAKMKGEDDHA